MKRLVFMIAVLMFIATVAGNVLANSSKPDLLSLGELIERGTNAEQDALVTRYMRSFTPSELLAELERVYPGAMCHRQAHPIGRAVYKETKNLADSIAVCGRGCNDGCFHGAIMQMFVTNSDNFGGVIEDEDPTAYLAAVQKEASTLCERPEVQGAVLPIFCVHGVGHVFTYSSGYDIKKATDMCSAFEHAYAKRACAGGAFMEYAGNRSLDEVNAKTEVSFCDPFAKEYRPYCYRYMAEHWFEKKSSPLSVIDQCRTLSPYSSLQCFYGVAYAFTRAGDGISANGVISSLCEQLEGRERTACISGATDMVASNQSTPSTASCMALLPEYRPLCEQTVRNNNSFSFK